MLTGHLLSRIWCTTGVQSQFTAAGNSSLHLVLLILFPLLFFCSSPYFPLLFIPHSLLSFLFHFQIFFFFLSFSSFFSTSFYSASPYLLDPPPFFFSPQRNCPFSSPLLQVGDWDLSVHSIGWITLMDSYLLQSSSFFFGRGRGLWVIASFAASLFVSLFSSPVHLYVCGMAQDDIILTMKYWESSSEQAAWPEPPGTFSFVKNFIYYDSWLQIQASSLPGLCAQQQ